MCTFLLPCYHQGRTSISVLWCSSTWLVLLTIGSSVWNVFNESKQINCLPCRVRAQTPYVEVRNSVRIVSSPYFTKHKMLTHRRNTHYMRFLIILLHCSDATKWTYLAKQMSGIQCKQRDDGHCCLSGSQRPSGLFKPMTERARFHLHLFTIINKLKCIWLLIMLFTVAGQIIAVVVMKMLFVFSEQFKGPSCM